MILRLGVSYHPRRGVMNAERKQEEMSFDPVTNQRRVQEHLRAGVSIVDPEHTYLGAEVQIAPGAVLWPGTYLWGSTRIGPECRIGPDCWIEDSLVDRGSIVRYAVVESARVRERSVVGPYAHLRPGADVGPDVRIGNFVEVKASRLERGVKAGHLSYIGDAHVGEETNVGAGTITCNFDGERKHPTRIESRVFIGSHVAIVAPVTIGEGAFIGAGSTITEDVPPDTLALARARQVLKKHHPSEDGAKEDR